MNAEQLEVEIFGLERVESGLTAERIRQIVEVTLIAANGLSGHLAVEFVSVDEMHRRNREFRGIDKPTDVLSFPIDGTDTVDGPRELGDIVICPEHTVDLDETVVHGTLHLLGMDHEVDGGEMLALQDQIVGQLK